MLKTILNKKVVITYQVGYSSSTVRGIVTKVATNYLMINDDIIIAVDKIVKIVLKKQK